MSGDALKRRLKQNPKPMDNIQQLEDRIKEIESHNQVKDTNQQAVSVTDKLRL